MVRQAYDGLSNVRSSVVSAPFDLARHDRIEIRLQHCLSCTIIGQARSSMRPSVQTRGITVQKIRRSKIRVREPDRAAHMELLRGNAIAKMAETCNFSFVRAGQRMKAEQ